MRSVRFCAFCILASVACDADDTAPAGGGGKAGTGGAAGSAGSVGTAGTNSEGGSARGGAGGSGGNGGVAGNGGALGSGGIAGQDAAAGGSAGAEDGGRPDGNSTTDGGSPDSVWSPLSVLTIVNPMDHGGVGDGTADDLGALTRSVDALPAAGGVVYLPPGTSFKKTNLLVITKSHVKFWAPNRQAEIFQSVAGQRRRQSLLCRDGTGCGFFGLKLRSDSAARFDALEDNQISADGASLIEVAGCDIQGSAATGIFLFGSTEHYIEGNYVHHTWADHIHHTNGARESWVWNNFIFNEDPSRGDDGVACVTYGPASPRCASMEWWNNTILHTGWGRGYSVIGGNDIRIHHNFAIGVAGAGIIVASESSFNSASSDQITIENNNVYQCGHTVGHPGILLSGQHTAAAPLNEIRLRNNVSADNPNGAYRAEGAYTNVTNEGLLTAASALPMPIPTAASARMADTAHLRTRDVSHVAATFRPGLHRIHVRRAPTGAGFQQRFEYVVKGTAAAVESFVSARVTAGDYLSEQRNAGGTTYALVLTRTPVALPSDLSAVTFRELRTGDASGELGWLWRRVDTGSY
jgi:hypothetical protein